MKVGKAYRGHRGMDAVKSFSISFSAEDLDKQNGVVSVEDTLHSMLDGGGSFGLS